MNILSCSFEYFNNRLFLVIKYDDGKIKKYHVKDKYRETLYTLLIDITILDKYR